MGHCVSKRVFTTGSSYQVPIHCAVSCFRLRFSHLSTHLNHREDLSQHRLLGPTPRILISFIWSGSLRTCVSGKLPVDTEAAGLGLTLGESLVEQCQR